MTCEDRMAQKRARHVRNATRWRANNLERSREIARNSYERRREKVEATYRENREARIEYQTAWAAANIEKKRASRRAWGKAHPDKANAHTAARYAAKTQSTPKWADKSAIEAFYTEAVRLTRETGIPHQVDHTIPLRSKFVCGLHCEANLSVVPALENHAKNNRYWPDMPDSAKPVRRKSCQLS